MKTVIKFLCVLTLVFGLLSCGYERVGAGHAVNIEGLKKLCDHVTITNSYCNQLSNNNLTVIDVCK